MESEVFLLMPPEQGMRTKAENLGYIP